MKKVLLIVAVALFGLGVSNAQEEGFKVGLTGAYPIGTAGDITSFGAGLDVAYLWEAGDSFMAGATTGYYHFIGKDIDYGFGVTQKINFQFIPVAAVARYSVSESVYVGADVGYGLGIGDTSGGDFYYRPKVGFNFGSVGVHVSYAAVGSFGFIGAGVEFGF